MIVWEATTATVSAATIEEGVRARPRDAGRVVEAEARTATGAGVAVLGEGTATKDDHPQGAHPRPLDTAVGLIRVRRNPATPGDPGHNPLLPGEILEAMAPCHRLPGAVHHLPPVAIAAAQLAATVGRVHHQDPLRGPILPQENAAVRLPPVLRCRLALGEAEAGIER